MMEQRTIVHKVNIPMLSGESIHAFLRALEQAVVDEFQVKTDIEKCDGPQGRPYLLEVFSDSLVFYAFGEGGDDHFATRFARDTDGEFSFGELIEVVPVSGFRPKPKQAPTLMKSIDVNKTLSDLLGQPYFGNETHMWFSKTISSSL